MDRDSMDAARASGRQHVLEVTSKALSTCAEDALSKAVCEGM